MVTNMSNQIKELILKVLLVIDIFLLFAIFPGCFLIALLLGENIGIVVFNTVLIAFFGVGILFIILLLIFGGLKQKPVIAEKKPFVFVSYNEFFNFIQKRLLQKEYQMQKKVTIQSDGEIIVYLKPSKNWKLTCFTIIRISELSNDLLNDANASITVILNEYYSCKTITDEINMISVFCVNRITPAFQKLVNSNVQQGLKNGRLPVGISLGGKSIYIARQKDGFAITKYRQLRNEFIDIMNLKDSNKKAEDNSAS